MLMSGDGELRFDSKLTTWHCGQDGRRARRLDSAVTHRVVDDIATFSFRLIRPRSMLHTPHVVVNHACKKGSPYSITERRVPELIPVLGSQPTGDVSHKPGGRLPLLSARPAVTPATLKRAATNFTAW